MHLTLDGLLQTLGIGILVLFILYRRFRRNFGRQKLRPARLWVRVVVLSLVCVLLLLSPYRTDASLMMAALGAVIGIGLAFYALLHTRFETTSDGRFYTPNPWIGLGVTALLVGRLVYRFSVVYPVMHHAMRAAAQNPHLQPSVFGAYQRSPLTLGIYFLLAGYYIAYYVSLLVKQHQFHQPADTPNS